MTVSPALIKAVILFPLNVMVTIPALILWFSRSLKIDQLKFLSTFSGSALVVVGLSICWITVSLFTDHGKGTPAPWAPPKILVVHKIYSYVRNPMMIGVWFVLVGEAILCMSVGILIWFLIFFSGSILLVQLWEERDLEKRFGESYLQYKREVPRWIPKMKPWERSIEG